MRYFLFKLKNRFCCLNSLEESNRNLNQIKKELRHCWKYLQIYEAKSEVQHWLYSLIPHPPPKDRCSKQEAASIDYQWLLPL